MLSVSSVIELLGTIAFTISGAFSAMQKRLDAFGVIVIAFITAIGGGTIRDVLIGYTPVSWMRDLNGPILITITAVCAIFFKKYLKNFKVTLFLFDALGLGLFTLIGIQKGVDAGLNNGVCVILGTITGCFGGVLRDILLNNIPLIFRKEIYATACIVGGAIYFGLSHLIDPNWAKVIAIAFICGIRILAVKYDLKLPVW
jgi:uncharacterized membrane protein YeiH